jgi:signal transduction histidine kinase
MAMRVALEGFTIRAVMIVGFGLMVALWSFAGYRLAVRMADVQDQAAEIDQRYVRAQDLLAGVRAQVLLASVVVRDAVIDPDPGMEAQYKWEIEQTYEAADMALQEYVPVLDSPVELEHIRRLREEIKGFRSRMLDIMGAENSQWPNDALQLLRGQVAPGRDLVLRVAEDVQRLNRASYVQQQATIAGLNAAADRQMWQQLGLVLALSLGIGLLASWHVGQLENRLQRQHEKDAETTRRLQLLSGRLISAQEEERRRVARELHDQLGQELTVLRLNLEALRTRSAERPDLHDHIKGLETIARQLDRDVDFLVWELRPTALDDFGLRAALARLTQNWSKLSGIAVELHSIGSESERLPAQIETTLFRVAQEALNNIAKHARASRVDVILERRSNQVSLIVEDNGVGFDPVDEKASEERMGLAGMRERVVLVGGTISVESTPDKGTGIFVRVPLGMPTDNA